MWPDVGPPLNPDSSVLQTTFTTTRGASALTTEQDSRQHSERGSPGHEGNGRSLALVKVPAVRVGAFAHPSGAQTGRGLHCFTQLGPDLASTFGTFSNILPAIAHRSVDLF